MPGGLPLRDRRENPGFLRFRMGPKRSLGAIRARANTLNRIHSFDMAESNSKADPAILSTLQGCPLFQGLDGGEILTLMEIGSYVELRKGDVLFKEGDECNELYIVLEGCLGTRTHIVGETEGNIALSPVIAEHGVGEAVGDFSFFDGKPRSAEVFAMADTRALAIETAAFRNLSSTRPETAEKIMTNMLTILIARIRKTDNQLSIALEWGWEARGFGKRQE
jgi:hypothetical protein